ncbi:DUF3997 domain-containing protein [Candidatus Clostridium stratigraminis]|uniref:DUF3997 domain-containing protein n=1 Tax=Candidatus Clostridium stratigraminis TaxID=3381661 RepID=A0ABW8T5U9_9CLOT
MPKKYSILGCIIALTLTFIGCDFFGPGMADFNYDLPGGYSMFHAGGDNFINKDSVKAIEGNVNGIAWNNDFILVRQIQNNKTNYWIVDVQAPKLYGPLDEKDFTSRRTELKVDNSLKLEAPEKYKSLEKKLEVNS